MTQTDHKFALRTITFDTVRTITDLEGGEKQRDYVPSNAVSIAEAHFNPGHGFARSTMTRLQLDL